MFSKKTKTTTPANSRKPQNELHELAPLYFKSEYQAHKKEKYVIAANCYKKAAELGYAKAQFYFGYLTQAG